MRVELLTRAESLADMERFSALAALTCHANTDNEFVPSDVLKRIIKWGHESILEHINLTYSVKGLSRACLQELARHRHISLSVESTRHTLKEFLKEHNAIEVCGHKYLRDMAYAFEDFAKKCRDMPNDELKYYLPEFWPTNLILTVNIRELRHIIKLRTSPTALKEFQELARALYEAVSEGYRYLLADCVYQEGGNE